MCCCLDCLWPLVSFWWFASFVSSFVIHVDRVSNWCMFCALLLIYINAILDSCYWTCGLYIACGLMMQCVSTNLCLFKTYLNGLNMTCAWLILLTSTFLFLLFLHVIWFVLLLTEDYWWLLVTEDYNLLHNANRLLETAKLRCLN